MLIYLNAIIFGIIQGVTEFLPVSSSGHLVILHEFLNIPLKDELAFDVILHLATLLAVVWFFRKDIQEILVAWTRSLRGASDSMSRLGWYIILATVPAAIAGYFFEDFIESALRSPIVVAIMLIVVGVLFIVIEKISKKTQELSNLSWKKSLTIGLAQVISLIPGTSRSGITIIAGLGTGLKREVALKFSFLLSIPIILGASLKKIPAIFEINFSGNELIILIIAFLASLVTGILTIKFFLKFAKRYSLNIFAYYRFILAAVILILFWL